MSTYSGVSWRLIEDGAASGPFNMGLDEALLHSAAREGIATLRFYSWDGPWLSLGYAQRHFEPEKMEACERAGIAVEAAAELAQARVSAWARCFISQKGHQK